MNCPNCGTELTRQNLLDENTIQCPGCGAVYKRKGSQTQQGEQISTQATTDNVDEHDNAQPSSRRSARKTNSHSRHPSHKRRSMRFPVWILLVIAAVIVGGLIIGRVIGRGSDMKSSHSITLFESKDTKAAKELLSKLEKSFNDQDLYGISQCFDPTMSDMLFGALQMMGYDGDALKEMMPFASKVAGQSGILGNNDWGKVKLSLVEFKPEGMEGKLTYKMSLAYNSGSTESFNDTVDVIKVGDTWYLSAFQTGDSDTYGYDMSGTYAETGNSDVPAGTSAPTYEPIPVKENITDADVAGELFIIQGRDGYFAKYGYINKSGVEIVAPYFSGMKSFVGDYCPVSVDGGSWGLIDRKGNLVTDYIYPALRDDCGEGFYKVKGEEGEVYGLLNPYTGKSISCSYQDVGIVSTNGLVPVKKSGYWGVIDLDENLVVDYLYDRIDTSYRANGLAVCVNGSWGVIDEKGNYLLPLTKADYIQRLDSGLTVLHHGFTQPYDVYDSRMNLLLAGVTTLDVVGDKVVIATKVEYINDVRTTTGYVFGDGGAVYVDCAALMGPNAYATTNSTENYYVVVSDDRQLNIADKSGRMIFSQPFDDRSIYASIVDGLNWVFVRPQTGDNVTYIYDLKTGSPYAYIPQNLYATEWYDDHYMLCYYSKDIGSACMLINLADFSQTESFPKADTNPPYPILGDGTFYGVFANGQFIGRGLQYTSVNYDEGLQIYTMNVGATSEQYRIGADGTVNQLQ